MPADSVSPQDILHLRLIRENVRRFLADCGRRFGGEKLRILDIAPQDHEGARPYFPPAAVVETLDINPAAGATYTGDLCRTNACLPEAGYDLVVCTEVLEHTLQPFAAVAEMRRILRPGGHLLLSVPFNFRIHGPLPDCWRFTEHGLRALLADWDLIELVPLETTDRFLMPIHYTVVARRPSP